jgi:hypothetical protein
MTLSSKTVVEPKRQREPVEPEVLESSPKRQCEAPGGRLGDLMRDIEVKGGSDVGVADIARFAVEVNQLLRIASGKYNKLSEFEALVDIADQKAGAMCPSALEDPNPTKDFEDIFEESVKDLLPTRVDSYRAVDYCQANIEGCVMAVTFNYQVGDKHVIVEISSGEEPGEPMRVAVM